MEHWMETFWELQIRIFLLEASLDWTLHSEDSEFTLDQLLYCFSWQFQNGIMADEEPYHFVFFDWGSNILNIQQVCSRCINACIKSKTARRVYICSFSAHWFDENFFRVRHFVLTAFSLRTEIVESLTLFGKAALLHISARKRLAMQEQLSLRN